MLISQSEIDKVSTTKKRLIKSKTTRAKKVNVHPINGKLISLPDACKELEEESGKEVSLAAVRYRMARYDLSPEEVLNKYFSFTPSKRKKYVKRGKDIHFS